MLDKLFPPKNTAPELLTSSVRVVGGRSSGKTTYMAALARWPNADPANSSVQTVTPVNKAGQELINIAKNLLEQGETLEPTPLDASIKEVKDYGLKIVLKPDFSWGRAMKGMKDMALEVNCKDYPGEFFSDLLYKTGDALLKDYVKDCNRADGLLLLLDGLASEETAKKYARGLEELLKLLDRTPDHGNNKRIAVVVNKCEHSDLKVNRQQPKRIISSRFSEVIRVIEAWQNLGAGEVDYFATSAFGLYGYRNPLPNMKKINTKIINGNEVDLHALDEPESWKPFGLVAPIYWLCTGKRHSKLDME